METQPKPAPQSAASQILTVQAPNNELQYHINILQNNTRIRSPTTVNVTNCPGFSSLVQHAHDVIGDAEGLELQGIRVLTMSGLVEVGDEEKWAEVLHEFSENEWLGADVRIVVDMV